jgi:hypothetical protein
MTVKIAMSMTGKVLQLKGRPAATLWESNLSSFFEKPAEEFLVVGVNSMLISAAER